MTTEKVNDLEIVPLLSYFDPKKFRLIPADAQMFSGGIRFVLLFVKSGTITVSSLTAIFSAASSMS